MKFVHLHNHTEYSLLDGACRVLDNKGNPGPMIKLARKYGMPALAITDHGNMFGVIEFYEACMEEGIKPIIGCELYLDPEGGDQRKSFHLTVLAKNNTGYKNLMKLLSKGFTENLSAGKGKIRKSWLKEYNEGLIALSGCLEGEIGESILGGKPEKEIKNIVEFYIDCFGKENFYLELMDNAMEEQKKLIPELIKLSQYFGLDVVATNDVHYITKEEAELQDILLCIGTGTTLKNPKRLKFATQEFYFKSPEEMMKLFKDYPEAIENTLKIALECNVVLNFGDTYLPEFVPPDGKDLNTYLKELCEEGLKKRYEHISLSLSERLDYELNIIKKRGFAGYFLIVYDFINYAKSKGIPVGPGRGSGAGSLVSYCLGITDVDPIKYGLLFERFLNPERKGLPDLDIDFADYRRDEIIDYVSKKYGEKNVVHIITFNTIKARNAIRDVARVMELPLSLADKIAKLVPYDMEITEALQEVKELKNLYSTDEQVKQLLDYAKQVEGRKRHVGIHAAGVIISKGDITDYTPLYKRSKEDPITTQYYDELLLKLGLLKIDLLGLKTLTVIEETIKLINEHYNIVIDITKIPLDDKKTFKLLQEGNTVGVFQLESAGMQDLLRKLKPTMFEDIIACNALHRPGPIGSGMVNEFIERKHQRKEIKYDHRILEEILKETYGVIVYQEQVMKIAEELCRFSPSEADDLRRAIAKKIPEEIKSLEKQWIDGAKKNGVDTRIAEKIFQQIEHFGEYGFNKSHATAYALISYRCAYLKANYPAEYLTALLNSELRSGANIKLTVGEEEKKFIKYLHEGENIGITILPPDINMSEEYFIKESDKNIRFGLLGIKGVGVAAAEFIVELRKKTGKYKSFDDFITRVNPRKVNKKVIEDLILSGSMDSLSGKDKMSIEEKCIFRKHLLNLLEKKSSLKNSFQQELMFHSEKKDKIIPEEKFTEHELFNFEHMLTGVYWSGHPLEKHFNEIKSISKTTIDLLPDEEGEEVEVIGMITNVKKSRTKNNQTWCKINLEDLSDEIKVIIFSRVYEDVHTYIHRNNIVFVKGKISTSDGEKCIVADELYPFDKAKEKIYKNYKKIYISLSTVGIDDVYINNLKKLFDKYPGEIQVYFRVITKTFDEVVIETDYKIIPSDKMLHELKLLTGEGSYKFE